MARALIIGCGCRGLELGGMLLDRGWQVRGTTRSDARIEELESAGIEAVVADPDRVGSVVDHLADVSLVVWALGSPEGEPDQVEALNRARVARMLEQIVDTPVRGFVYDGAGSAPPAVLAAGSALVREAAERWRIPVAVVEVGPAEWAATVAREADRLLGI